MRSGRRTGLVTLDAYRVGAVAQLEAYAELLGVPCRAPRDAAQFVAGLGSLPVFDALLVDTTGAVERDRERLADLAARLPRAYRLRSYLVLSAATDRAALERVTEACAGQELAGCVVTKLDETCTPAPVLEHVLERGLPVAFLSDGPDLAHDFHRPTPEHFADLFLRGRLR